MKQEINKKNLIIVWVGIILISVILTFVCVQNKDESFHSSDPKITNFLNYF